MIYVIRHGQTNYNLEKKVMGRVDAPLNEIGIDQAYFTKEKLKDINIDLIISSPLLRTKQTTEIINNEKNIPVVYDSRIIERDFGEFENLHYDEYDNETLWDYYKNEKYAKAESMKEFFDRIYSFLDDINKKFKDKNILLITHGGVSVAINCYFNKHIPEGSLSNTNLFLKNCEIATYLKNNKSVDMFDDIDYEKLKKDLTKFLNFLSLIYPAARLLIDDLENMGNIELIKLAKESGFDISEYKKKGKCL